MAENTELDELAERHLPTKIVHDYFRHYWRHFSPVKHKVRSLLEIGVQRGHSLKVWRDFFPNAEIYGIDIDPSCRAVQGERIHIFIGDSVLPSTAGLATKSFGIDTFDIIIDDGAHDYVSQVRTFLTWFPYVRKSGIYVVEDVAQFLSYDRLGTIEAFTELVYGINYLPQDPPHWRDVVTFNDRVPELVRSTCGISFYRYIIFVDKGNNPEDNRYLTDPSFNRLDIDAQLQQDRNDREDVQQREAPYGTSSNARLRDLFVRFSRFLRYYLKRQHLIGRPGKPPLYKIIARRLRLRKG